MDISPQHLILSIVLGLIIGGWTSYLAKFRGRDPRIWFLLGFCFGLLGLLALLVMPDLSNRKEEEVEVVVESVIPDAEDKQWYYLDTEGVQKGPVELSFLENLYVDKKISSTSFVWCEGMEEWKTIEECQLFTS
jgi:hypothetical protein